LKVIALSFIVYEEERDGAKT